MIVNDQKQDSLGRIQKKVCQGGGSCLNRSMAGNCLCEERGRSPKIRIWFLTKVRKYIYVAAGMRMRDCNCDGGYSM